MSWTIISVRAPAYMVEDSHNRPFHTSEELPWIDNDTAIDSEDGTPAPGRPPPDVTLCITTRNFPKNPGVGFVFGRDRETCDVLLPPECRGISKRQFAITFRTDCSAVILRNLSKHLTYVEDELGPRRLQTQISFGQDTIRVRLSQLDIELTRPWRDDEITSPLYTSFLAKLEGMLPSLGRMRLASSTGSTMQPSTSRSQDGYRLGAVLGHGKSAIVYRGSHRETGDIVAIKRYDQSSSGSAEACKELGILSTLNHKHIIIIHAFHFCIRQQAQLIMEYAPLGSMACQSRARRFLYREARTIFHQVLQALSYLHSKGITHRDVKPDNILIITREPIHAKLADFALSSNAKRPMTVCGTERYTAPEVYRPPYTAKVDIWSVGVMVMELWIGLPDQPKTAEYGKWAEMLRTNRRETAKPEIQELLDACLQLQPTERLSAEQCLKLAFFRMLPHAAGATHEIDATRSASPTKVVDGLLERAPCHAIEDDLPDTAPCFTVEDGLPDTAPCHTEKRTIAGAYLRIKPKQLN
ncbi:Serine/threonine-protein kinase [Cordyceps militaris CM01]|uniref:Autophagy-related protein 1 n=1 Tax=Cordyceps militaris (strain CM01) TaxID=983644 RepID=G3J4F7_CORMM|nr:Serine/threonine-protein kinase [Cordyceps militaris CM01]EGX96674.1 Serine/threonine-protein kinase [Cordyceps militaris CM01]